MDIFVARQPIFDDRKRLAGYELLYRSGARNAACFELFQGARERLQQARR